MRPRIEAQARGKFVAIDVHTGEFEVSDNILAAAKQLSAREPNAEIWLVRVGERSLHRIGSLRGSHD